MTHTVKHPQAACTSETSGSLSRLRKQKQPSVSVYCQHGHSPIKALRPQTHRNSGLLLVQVQCLPLIGEYKNN